jgi:hypothetical protein
MAKHLDDQLTIYRRLTMVNLIDFKGSNTQRKLG